MFISVVTILGIASYVLFYRLTCDSLNPFGIGSLIWSVAAGASSLSLSNYEKEWVFETYLAVCFCLAAIIGVGLLSIFLFEIKNKKEPKEADEPTNMKWSRAIIAIACIVCISASICELSINDFALAAFSGDFDAKSSFVAASSPIHLLSALLPYCCLLALFDFLFFHRDTISVIFNIAVITYVLFFVAIAQVSRGSLLTIAFGFIFLLSRKMQVKPWQLAVISAVFLGLFYFAATVRIGQGSLVFRYTEHSPAFNAIYSYISANFNNLNTLIESGSHYTIVAQSMPILQMDVDTSNDIEYMTAGVLNAQTWLFPFYWDLGLFGTFVYPAVCFAFVAVIYNESLKSKAFIPLMAFMQKAICVTFFGNYFSLSGLNILVIILGIAYALAWNTDCYDGKIIN